MKTRRLTRCVDIVRLWPFFAERLEFVRNHLRFNLPVTVYRRILQHEVRNPLSWVAVVEDDDGTPINFACAHEVTPLFCREREYEISMFFHERENLEASRLLQSSFELWCKENKICRYVVSTRRVRRGCMKLLVSPAFGLKLTYTVFKKEIK